MNATWHVRIIAVLVVLTASVTARAADADLGPTSKEVQVVLDKALAYLRDRQSPDGTFSFKQQGPGITALVAAAALCNGVSADDPLVAKALKGMEKSVKPDGGVYDKALANYMTSVAIMAFAEANTDGRYDTLLKNATKFLKALQHADKADIQFGGVGYDSGRRPDVSNTQMFVEALLKAGVPKDDPAIKQALEFMAKCQNLPGETNPLPFAKKTTTDDKGGLTYTPIGAEDSEHKTETGGLRSLGAMTYAGLKSFLYAGVSRDDPRVKAAIDWVRAHYTLDANPGMKSKEAGLYYYYHTFAKAMDAWGEDRFKDKDGKEHDWRRELFEALKKRQLKDGSWINTGDQKFGESNPELATAFAVLALSYCQPKKK